MCYISCYLCYISCYIFYNLCDICFIYVKCVKFHATCAKFHGSCAIFHATLHVLYFLLHIFYILCYNRITIYQERSLILNSQLFSLTSCKTRYSCQSQVILMRNPKCFLFLIFNCICSILREFISRVFSCNLKIFWDIISHNCPGTL